jgi:hypothetical protein
MLPAFPCSSLFCSCMTSQCSQRPVSSLPVLVRLPKSTSRPPTTLVVSSVAYFTRGSTSIGETNQTISNSAPGSGRPQLDSYNFYYVPSLLPDWEKTWSPVAANSFMFMSYNGRRTFQHLSQLCWLSSTQPHHSIFAESIHSS